VDEWLTRARDSIADEAGIEPAALALSQEDADTLLDLARIAARVSGERTNAPLLCYLVGRAQGSGSLAALAEAVRRSTS
jgi:Domain of unknown function (DUF6457)